MTYKEGPIQAVWETHSDQSPYWEVGKLYGFGPEEWTCGKIIEEEIPVEFDFANMAYAPTAGAPPPRILIIDHLGNVRVSLPYTLVTFTRMGPENG